MPEAVFFVEGGNRGDIGEQQLVDILDEGVRERTVAIGPDIEPGGSFHGKPAGHAPALDKYDFFL